MDKDDLDLPPIARPSWLGKSTRSSVTSDDISRAEEEIKNNPDLANNGWTKETLATYFKERTEAQSNTVLNRRKPRPTRTNGIHNAHRWRR